MTREDLLRLREVLDAMPDEELRSLVGDEPSRGSWAWTGTAEVDGTPVFVKRIPVTAPEVEVWPSTRNLFDLPLSYQYGVGSAGFGAAREVSAQRAVTDWVRAGETDVFPDLLHSRLVERAAGEWEVPRERNWYLGLWGGDEAIAAFVDARVAAGHEVWLVSEHVPHRLAEWLLDHQDRVDDVLERLLSAASLMRERGIVHFDAHFENVVVDDAGERFCLSDFGLASSDSFELSPDEREFLGAHRHYDVGEILFSTTGVVSRLYLGLDEEAASLVRRACEVADDADQGAVLTGLVAHTRRLADEGLLALDPAYVAALERYRPVIDQVGGFLWALSRDPAKRARHDDVELVACLRDCGVEV